MKNIKEKSKESDNEKTIENYQTKITRSKSVIHTNFINKKHFFLPNTTKYERGSKLSPAKKLLKFPPKIETKFEVTKEYVFNHLLKSSDIRSNQENTLIAEYLSEHYQYFTKLKNKDSQLKVEKITKVCRIEKFSPGESIIKYGEIGDKFYIVLEGIVEVFTPKYVEVEMYPKDFIRFLLITKNVKYDELKYKRMKAKNDLFFGGIKDLTTINPNLGFMKNKHNFLIEDEEKRGEYSEGFAFGEIALINKTVRNATIKSKTNSILLTIEKDDYNKAIYEFQRKALSKELEAFSKKYSFFQNFNSENILQVYNFFGQKTIYKGEYLYKQNDESDYIYILKSGTLSMYSIISFFWLNDYISYIDYNKKGVLQYILKKKNAKINELLQIMSRIREYRKKNTLSEDKDRYKIWEKFNQKSDCDKDDFYTLKQDEENLNNPEKLFKVNLKKIDYNELIGLEEGLEFKKRFCSVKCISKHAELKTIKISDLIKILINFRDEDISYLLNVIKDRKNILKSEIINGVKNLEKNIMFNFDIRYENLIKSSEKCNDEENKNMLVTAIKMKGYKNGIQDILDDNIPYLSSNIPQKKLLKKNKTENEILIKILRTNKQNNIFKFKKINIKRPIKFERNIPSSKYNAFNYNENSSTKINNKDPLTLNKSLAKTFSESTVVGKKSNYVIISPRRNKNMRKRNLNKMMNKNNSMTSFDENKFKQKTIFKYSTPNGENLQLHNSTNNISRKNLTAIKNTNQSISCEGRQGKYDNISERVCKNTKYKYFYNIFKVNKNFFLGSEFHKKLKKELKSANNEILLNDKNKITKNFFKGD